MRDAEDREIAVAIIALMQGVVYRTGNEDAWNSLERFDARVKDHFAQIGIDVVVDAGEGYAYLRTKAPLDGEDPLPSLVRRRALTYGSSLLLVLLRKKLLEFDASGGEGKLVLSREQMVEMVRVFQADSTNEVRMIRQADAAIRKAAELGFLRQLRGGQDLWEVPRILKAYVDAEVLGDLDQKLASYVGAKTDVQAGSADD